MKIESSEDYQKIKAELKDKQWRKDNLHGSAEFTWHMKQHIQLLEAVLLQYRRQHNIFEVEDYVFLRDSHFTELWIVTNILKDGSIEIKTAVHGYPVPSKCWGMYYGKSNGLIHATNEEIQAGRRLEVYGG